MSVSGRGPTGQFQSTNWSVIGRLETDEFADALATLCQQYWYPVYAFVRQRVRDTHQAEDLTQGFFAQAISKKTFRMADPGRGRFRTFLLTSVKNYIANEYKSAHAKRRGGDENFLPVDAATADQLYQRNGTETQSPEQAFERAWALAVLERSIERLKVRHEQGGDALRFELFKPCLRSETLDYNRISEQLDISLPAARKAVSRFRMQYGQCLREEISGTLSDEEDIDEEVSWMMSALGE